MHDAGNEKAQADTIRKQAIDIFDDLKEKANQFELSKPPQALEDYRQRLARNEYNVLVVGEAKRGKSSFVNALIGRNLLPTDVDIATNQVFRVHHDEHETYRLRFEDNTTQAITAEQLTTYGSEAAAEPNGFPRFAKTLYWIEVDVPVRFLPMNMSALDTPGTGTLYAAHAQITQRFVPLADAVIYVLESSKPLDKLDIDFIEKILAVTHYIFFVQTKIDRFRREQWQEVQKRNEAILQKQFQNRLTETRVWPISSLNLMKAAQTNDEDYWIVSRHKQMDAALQPFLFKAAGWERCAQALTMADYYYTSSRNVLSSRLSGLETVSQQGVSAVQQLTFQRKQQFDAEWGSRGKKRKELMSHIQRTIALHKQSFTELLQTDSRLEMARRDKINAVKSIDEANTLGASMDADVIKEIIDKWHAVCEQSRLQAIALLNSFIEATSELIVPPSEPDLEIHIEDAVTIKGNLWDKLMKAQTGFRSTSKNAYIVAGIMSYFFTSSLFPPLAIVGILGAGVWAAARGWRAAQDTQLKEVQRALHEHLTDVLSEVRERFFFPNQAYDGQNLVNYYFDTLADAMEDQIQQIADEKSDEAQAEIARLDGEAKLDEQQRSMRTRQLQGRLSEWDNLGRLIRSTAMALQSSDRSLVTDPVDM